MDSLLILSRNDFNGPLNAKKYIFNFESITYSVKRICWSLNYIVEYTLTKHLVPCHLVKLTKIIITDE